MKEIKYAILYWMLVRTFVIPFYYGSGTVISNGSGSGSTRQKVTVPTVPVPQHYLNGHYLMHSKVAEITEEDDVGVGRLAVHAHATDGVLVHRGRVRLRTPARARNLGCGNIKGIVSRVSRVVHRGRVGLRPATTARNLGNGNIKETLS
jgi:hypothetical protein